MASSNPSESTEKPLAVSSRADPPITQEEAREAEPALCRRHRGIIASYQAGVAEGKVYYCPEGKQTWRFDLKDRNLYRPIKYPSQGIV